MAAGGDPQPDGAVRLRQRLLMLRQPQRVREGLDDVRRQAADEVVGGWLDRPQPRHGRLRRSRECETTYNYIQPGMSQAVWVTKDRRDHTIAPRSPRRAAIRAARPPDTARTSGGLARASTNSTVCRAVHTATGGRSPLAGQCTTRVRPHHRAAAPAATPPGPPGSSNTPARQGDGSTPELDRSQAPPLDQIVIDQTETEAAPANAGTRRSTAQPAPAAANSCDAGLRRVETRCSKKAEWWSHRESASVRPVFRPHPTETGAPKSNLPNRAT